MATVTSKKTNSKKQIKIKKRDLIKDLQRVKRERGVLSVAVYSKYGNYSVGTINRRFGSWLEGVSSANITPAPIGRRKGSYGVGVVELLKEFGEIATTLGHEPNVREYDKAAQHSFATILRRFGTWDNAKKSHKEYEKAVSDIMENSVDGVICQSFCTPLSQHGKRFFTWEEVVESTDCRTLKEFLQDFTEESAQDDPNDDALIAMAETARKLKSQASHYTLSNEDRHTFDDLMLRLLKTSIPRSGL